MQKVIVIGCSGAGKSTFSRKLAAKTGLALVHLDRIWHKADKTHITREAFDARLAEILRTDAWILDGDYSRTMETRLAACDTVFFFDLPLADCLLGVENRIGKDRPDMPWVETEFDPAFRAWMETFFTEKTPATYALLDKYRAGREIVIFKSRDEADAYLARL